VERVEAKLEVEGDKDDEKDDDKGDGKDDDDDDDGDDFVVVADVGVSGGMAVVCVDVVVEASVVAYVALRSCVRMPSCSRIFGMLERNCCLVPLCL
jgi:hypothetical protein|tara:strand:- start:350 stop:637 length:288 start_codon:yes stop_codon:yes gene_type:complete